MSYSRTDLAVESLFVVPGSFLSQSVISPRTPLSATARRAGWVGSNIHLDRIPAFGKIVVIADGAARPKVQVRKDFSQIGFVGSFPQEQRGWLGDVLSCLEKLDLTSGSSFHLGDLYAFEDSLRRLHPTNNNIQPKIRQQLQVLERQGIVRRLRPGLFQKV